MAAPANPTRRFLSIWNQTEALGAWVDENGQMLQVPAGMEEWKKKPFREFRDWLSSQGYQAIYDGRKM